MLVGGMLGRSWARTYFGSRARAMSEYEPVEEGESERVKRDEDLLEDFSGELRWMRD